MASTSSFFLMRSFFASGISAISVGPNSRLVSPAMASRPCRMIWLSADRKTSSTRASRAALSRPDIPSSGRNRPRW